jgi:hypothetical protein
VSEIEVGQGMETHRNYRGLLMNRASIAVVGVVILLSTVAAFGANWWHRRQERKFEEFLRARSSPDDTAAEKSAGTGS